jgi:hypothetical protein
MQGPEAALQQLTEQLRHQDTVISSHVVEPSSEPVLGPLAAAGPRAAGAQTEYSLVVESIREGYELHYGTSRILDGQDENLGLLAGDYLYALGLERLAALGDDEAVAELADLISLSAACDAEGSQPIVPALWLGAAVAVGCGGSEAHNAAKAAVRSARPGAAEALLKSALQTAAAVGLEVDLDRVAESIDLSVPRPADSG